MNKVKKTSSPCRPDLLLRMLSALVLLLALAWAAPLHAAPPLKISLSVPGPHNLSFLPADLMRKIGADRIEGVELRIIHVGGGSGALRNLNTRNSDFAMLGMPAIMSQKAKGLDVVAIAAVNDAPLWTLMVRSDLKGEVRNIADLKGRTIGVTTSSATSKTVTQQVMEALLAQSGIAPGEVRFLSIGKNWRDQSACILSASVDAIMGDEPFATRLTAEGKVFILANPAIPELSPSIPGLGFLHATLVTRSDIINDQPEMAAAMVRILRRTLEWLASHSPDEVVAQLDPTDAKEREAIAAGLARYRNIYSRDARFSTRQLQETDTFFRATQQDETVRQLTVESLINDSWVGRKP